MKIDAHHHFWRYDAEEFAWIDDSLSLLRRDFLPEDLEREIRPAGIDGVVSVQARQTLDETNWLLQLAVEYEFIKGVVGWLPLADTKIREHLAELACHDKLKAVRHVIQAEAEDEFILRKDFNRGVAILKEFELAYDILIYERHLPYAIEFVDRHPEQVFVLDHIAKPRIKGGLIKNWATHLGRLAQRPNVYCKISGMVTEADFKTWTVEQLKPYWDIVLTAFGLDRIMFGSDWPVCTVASGYAQWYETVSLLAEQLSPTEQGNLFGSTACKVYRLEDSTEHK
jgi:L-fuconolactonase